MARCRSSRLCAKLATKMRSPSTLSPSASGPMLVPGTSLLVGGGKGGVLYVLNTASLGKENSPDLALQEIQALTFEMMGGPVYWQRSAANGGPILYIWTGVLESFPFNSTTNTFATTPNAQNTVGGHGFMTLSANGEAAGSGVLWGTTDASGDFESPPVLGELRAFDAGNVAKELWNSNMNAARDSFGNWAVFVPPLVANGRVYVATWSNQVAVYGLLGSAPTLTAVSPTSGPTSGGTAVTLTGANFASGATVSFGGIAATSVVVVSGTQITANTPPHAQGSVSVVVTNPNGQAATLTSGFKFTGPTPTLTAVSPTSGSTSGGTAVTLTGTNFVSGPTVTFGGTAASSVVVVVSGTQITANTPPHAAGTVSVVVTNPDGQTATLASGFTFTGAAPTLTAVSPTSGSTTGGTAVTLTGTNFVSGATVTFGGTAASSVVVVSGSQITAVTPAHKQGGVSVVVTNPGGQSGTLASGFTDSRTTNTERAGGLRAHGIAERSERCWSIARGYGEGAPPKTDRR
jgi:hypothetical protein